jgi:fatty acid desaturase
MPIARQHHRMDHREFLAALPVDARATLTARSNRAGLAHLAGHAALIAAFGTLIALRVPFWPLLLPLQGIAIIFLFTLEHEATHKTPFASERINEWVGRVAGFLILLPFGWFRYFHLAHHRFTNDPHGDPELATEKPATWGAWVRHVSGIPYWISQTTLMIRLVRGTERAPYLPEGALPRIKREARLMAGLYALAALSLLWTPLLLWVWIIPVLLGQPFLRLYLLAEHGDCPQVADMFLNTRTTFTTRIVRFLAWNMPYHTEHHVYPAVPFHHLPDLHVLMKDSLGVTADGYSAFTRAYLARRPIL